MSRADQPFGTTQTLGLPPEIYDGSLSVTQLYAAIANGLHAHRILSEARNRMLAESNEMQLANYEASVAIIEATRRLEEQDAAKAAEVAGALTDAAKARMSK